MPYGSYSIPSHGWEAARANATPLPQVRRKRGASASATPSAVRRKRGAPASATAKPQRGGSVTNPNARLVAPKRIGPPTPSDAALIRRKLGLSADATRADILAWQKRYNAAHPEAPIKEDGIAGEQTRTAMGVRTYLPGRNQMRAQGAGEGGAPRVTASEMQSQRGNGNGKFPIASWMPGGGQVHRGEGFWESVANDLKRYLPFAVAPAAGAARAAGAGAAGAARAAGAGRAALPGAGRTALPGAGRTALPGGGRTALPGGGRPAGGGRPGGGKPSGGGSSGGPGGGAPRPSGGAPTGKTTIRPAPDIVAGLERALAGKPPATVRRVINEAMKNGQITRSQGASLMNKLKVGPFDRPFEGKA